MDKKEKLFLKLENNPNDAMFSDIRKLLEEEGFLLDRVTGSHHIFRKQGVIFVIPVHKKRVKSVYVRRAIAIIRDIKSNK